MLEIMDIITAFPASLSLFALLLLLLGLIFFLTAIVRIRRLRLLAASGHGLISLALLAAGIALVATGINLHTYQRFTTERPVAELDFEQTGIQQFKVRVHFPDTGQYRDFTLNGDEWQIDARVLKWTGLAILAGADTQYRLERISGRYQDIEAERSQPRSAHTLADNPGLDIWQLVHEYEQRVPWVDARYGSATYLPMRDGARFEVSMTQTGLIARPLNPAGERAIQNWR
jgi:hypothetical protein